MIMRLSYVLPIFVCLASQALAVVNITLGGTNFTANELLNFGTADDFITTANCKTNCSTAQTTIANCGTSDSCICSNKTALAMLDCEQCLFTFAIEQNIRVPNTLIGSQPALSGLVTACAGLNFTVPPQALKLPANWDGPESLKLGVPATVIAVIAGTLLGGASLYTLFNIE